MSKNFARALLFSCVNGAIGAAAGFFILGIYGLVAGAVVGLLLRPGVKRVAWFLVTLYGGQGEPEQGAHFWSRRRRRSATETKKPEHKA